MEPDPEVSHRSNHSCGNSEGLTSQAWTIFLESLRISVASVRFTANQIASIKSKTAMTSIYAEMEKLDKWVMLATAKAETHLPVLCRAELGPVNELVTAQVMRHMSRIRLCRCVAILFSEPYHGESGEMAHTLCTL